MADNDATPPRIRWQPEPGLFADFSGYVGTVEPALFRIYEPDAPDGEHALCSMLPGMGNQAFYGTETEVKARAEEWLAEFAASLGAVFPGITLWGVRFDGPGGVIQRYSDEADARQAKREVESLRPADKPAVMTRQTWAGEWKEADGG
jgi:hypothetical protein